MKLCILENDLFDAELAARFGGDSWTVEIDGPIDG